MTRSWTKNQRFFRSVIAIVLSLGCVLGGTPATQAQQSPGPAPTPATPNTPRQVDNQLLNQVRQAGGGNVEIGYHRETGKVRFIGITDASRPIAQSPGLGPGPSPEAAARAFLTTYGPLFGLQDPSRETRLMRQSNREQGRSTVRLQQVHQGVPIFGGELVVNLDSGRNVLSASGEVLPDLPATVSPSIDAGVSQTTALAAIGKWRRFPISDLRASQPELWIYNPALTGGTGPRRSSLVWRLEVTRVDHGPLRELVLVDALRGAVILHFNQTHTARNRETYTSSSTPALPGTLLCTEGNPGCLPSGDAHAVGAHKYAGETYDMYFNRFGRDSYDGAGATLVSSVHFSEFSGVPYDNAFWNGAQMVYGDAAAYPLADDVVAHELTHGVTEAESGLFYHFQSGAINESLSDIFGEGLDLTNSSGTDTPATRWLIAEDIGPGGTGAIRSMSNPPAFGDPDRMQSPNYTADNDESDDGGVHRNNGVSNKAAYLMVDGGTFNGKTVTPLGLDKTLWIYYVVNRDLLTSASDYLDLYNALQQACFNLLGVAAITSQDCAQVKNAVEAVEMQLPPLTANSAPDEAPICPAGQVPQNLFFDDLENTSSGNWSSLTISGANVWSYPPLPQFRYATSGLNDLDGFNASSITDSAMQMNVSVALPGGTSYLHFNRAFDFDDDVDFAYDGGVLEYSTNSGGSWADVTSVMSFTHGGYNGTMTDEFIGNPLNGRAGFVRESRGYGSSRLDLTPLAGQSVRFRFRIGTDNIVEDLGWFIDDVRVYTCGAGGGITVSPTSGLTTTEGGGTAQFSVRLNSLPASLVTVPLSSSDPTEGAVSPPALNFAQGNGTTPQTVTVVGVNDAITDGQVPYTIVTGPAVSADPTYNGVNAADVSLTNLECTTRPSPQISVAPNGAGGLSVTAIAGVTTISELRFHGAASAQVPSPNVLVDIGALVGQSGEFTVPIGASSVGFTIRRAVASGSATLPLEIVDGCGSWPTLIGGGPNAWGGGGGGSGLDAQPPTEPSGLPTPRQSSAAPTSPGVACATFPSHAAAQAQLRANPNDPLNIDRNRNGVACEGADGAGFVNPPFDHVPVPRP